MSLTQTELGELLGYRVFYINHIERGANRVSPHTFKHLSLIYAIHSLPPDAPVSILQELLTPPSVVAKREKAQERLAARKAKRSKVSKRKRSKRVDRRRNSPSNL